MRQTATASDFYKRYHKAFATVGTKSARLRLMLEAALRDSLWGDDGRMPTEHELARATGMSLGTIQRALRELVDEGRVVRTPKRGTYVVPHKYRLREPFFNASFLSDDGSSILPIDGSFVSRELVSEIGPWTRALKPATGEVLRIDRQHDVNGEFHMLTRFYVDPVRFYKFAQVSATRIRSVSLRRLLARMYRFPAVTHHQTLRFQRLPVEVCRLLRCRAGTIGLLQAVTASIRDDDIVYFIELFIPPNDRALRLPDAMLPR